MRARSRQRGHMDMGFIGWLIVWMPWILAGMGGAFLGLLGWAVWRLCK
ncbi:MAG: hypothetical protein Q7K57_44610 [Burkholderiaceae bacterium]|nr:hypothetical protein [Burkholderiaceae bacterium]